MLLKLSDARYIVSTMIKALCHRIIFLVLLFVPPAEAWALTIVKNGEAQAVIVVPANATKDEKSAARDLQTYLRKVSGVRIEIIPERVEPAKSPIYVGRCNAAESLGLVDEVSRLKDDGYIIKVASRDMFLIGKDPLATRFAVFGLLEDHFGVRWYMPGHVGEVVPESEVISIGKGEEVKEPSFAMRWVGSGDWALHNRMNVGVDSELGLHVYSPCHTLHKLCTVEQYFNNHPEYFALIDGERKQYEGVRRSQLCTSNQEVINVVSENAAKAFQENPELDFMTIFPSDYLGFCECENCTALDETGRISVEDVNSKWAFLGPDKYGVLSRRMAIFYNEVASRILQKYPNKHVLVGAYSAYLTPPKSLGIEPHENTIVEIVRSDCHDLPVSWGLCNLPYGEAIDGWKDTFSKFSIYECYWKQAANELPYPIVHTIRRDIPFYHEKGCFGLYAQYSSKNVGTLLLNYYIAAKLLWDVNADVDEILDDFYHKFYGPAWRPMKSYYETLEDAVKYGNVHLPAEYHELPMIFSKEVLDNCERYIGQARQAVKGTRILRKRVEMAETSFGYAKSAMEYVSYLQGMSKRLSAQPRELEISRELANKILRYMKKNSLRNCFHTPVSSYVKQFLNPDYAIRRISCYDGKIRLDKEEWVEQAQNRVAQKGVPPDTVLDIWVYGYDFNRDEEKAEHQVYLLDAGGRQVKIGDLPTVEGGGDKVDRCFVIQNVPAENFIQNEDTLELQILNPKGGWESSTIYAVYVMPSTPAVSSAEATDAIDSRLDELREKSFGFVEYCYGGMENDDGQTAKCSIPLYH